MRASISFFEIGALPILVFTFKKKLYFNGHFVKRGKQNVANSVSSTYRSSLNLSDLPCLWMLSKGMSPNFSFQIYKYSRTKRERWWHIEKYKIPSWSLCRYSFSAPCFSTIGNYRTTHKLQIWVKKSYVVSPQLENRGLIQAHDPCRCECVTQLKKIFSPTLY